MQDNFIECESVSAISSVLQLKEVQDIEKMNLESESQDASSTAMIATTVKSDSMTQIQDSASEAKSIKRIAAQDKVPKDLITASKINSRNNSQTVVRAK